MNNEVWPPDTSKRVDAMIEKIGDCMERMISKSPHGTIVKVDDDTWLIRDTGLTV